MNEYNFQGHKVKFELNLNDEQINAVNEIVSFIDGDETCMTLMGFAGTGKTTLMGIIKKIYMFDKKIQFAATTHKAAGVLKEKVDDCVSTVNSLFGIVVEQNFDVDQFDVTEKKRREGDNKLSRGSVVVIDEASMLSEDNFNDVMSKCYDLFCKVIFVGDPAQLAPVKEDDISIVFRTDLGKIVKLSKVERTGDNGILREATSIRNGDNLSYVDGDGISFISNKDGATIGKIFDDYIPGLKENPNFFRVLSFTNKNVENLNIAVRRKLGYEGLLPQQGEPMMSYSNWGYDGSRRYTGTPYRFINSESYLVDDILGEEVKDVSEYVEVEHSGDDRIPLVINKLRLKDALGITLVVPYIDVKNNKDNYRAAKLLSYQKLLLWNRWKVASLKDKMDYLHRINEIDDMLFVNDNIRDDKYGKLIQSKVIDFGYAHTIHKSQGSTFNHVLINDADICSCLDKKMRRQLRYVAITRASESASLIVVK